MMIDHRSIACQSILRDDNYTERLTLASLNDFQGNRFSKILQKLLVKKIRVIRLLGQPQLIDTHEMNNQTSSA